MDGNFAALKMLPVSLVVRISSIYVELRKEVTNMDNDDWGDSKDDWEPSDWEDYLGGPGDDILEMRDQDNNISGDSDEPRDAKIEQFTTNGKQFDKSHEKVAARKEEIVCWLESSKLAIRFRNGKGFFVPKGPHLSLNDNHVVDLFEWLNQEGIKGGKTISGYRIVYTEPESKYGEKLSFFKIVVDTPFSEMQDLPKS